MSTSMAKKVVICDENSLCHSNTLFYDLVILRLFDLIKLCLKPSMNCCLQQFLNVKYAILYVTRQSNKLKHVYAET